MTIIPLLTEQDRRAKEAVLAMAEAQLVAVQSTIARLRRELGLPETVKSLSVD